MKIKIINCIDPCLWYSEHVGKIFTTVGFENGEYITKEPNGFFNIIKEIDCVKINVIDGVLFQKLNEFYPRNKIEFEETDDGLYVIVVDDNPTRIKFNKSFINEIDDEYAEYVDIFIDFISSDLEGFLME